MPLFGAVILSLAGKAGIKPDDPMLKKILGFPEVAQLEVGEDFGNALEQKLLTEESARANLNVRKQIVSETLNGVDVELEGMLNEIGFDDTFKTEIKGTKNTNEKLRQIKAATKKLVEAKGKGSKADDAALQKEIEKLNAEAAAVKDGYEAKLSALQSTHANDKKDWNLMSVLGLKPLPKNGLPADVNIITAKTLITQALAKQGLSVVLDDNGNSVLKQSKDGALLPYFENNKPVEFTNFIDGVLAQNKFINVTDSNPNDGGTDKTSVETATKAPSNVSVVNDVDRQLAEMGI